MAAVVALDRGGTLLCLPAEQQGEGSSGTMLGSGVWKARQPGRCRDVFGAATVALTLPSRPGQGCGCAQCPLQATGEKTAPEPTGRAHPSRGETSGGEARGRGPVAAMWTHPHPQKRQVPCTAFQTEKPAAGPRAAKPGKGPGPAGSSQPQPGCRQGSAAPSWEVMPPSPRGLSPKIRHSYRQARQRMQQPPGEYIPDSPTTAEAPGSRREAQTQEPQPTAEETQGPRTWAEMGSIQPRACGPSCPTAAARWCNQPCSATGRGPSVVASSWAGTGAGCDPPGSAARWEGLSLQACHPVRGGHRPLLCSLLTPGGMGGAKGPPSCPLGSASDRGWPCSPRMPPSLGPRPSLL